MWTRTLVTHRFLELHDAILYMFTWQNNKVIKIMVNEEARGRFLQYVREMEKKRDENLTEYFSNFFKCLTSASPILIQFYERERYHRE